MEELLDLKKFDAIHDAYASQGFQYANNQLGDKRLAEEALQETFIYIFHHLHKISNNIYGRQFKYNFFRILFYDCLDVKRAHEEDDMFVSLECLDKEQPLFVTSKTVEEMSETRELVGEVAKRISALSKLEQNLMVDRAWLGMGYKAISKKHNISVSNAKVKVSRIRTKLGKGLVSTSDDIPMLTIVDLAVQLWYLKKLP